MNPASESIPRRTFLAYLGALGAVVVPGCSGGLAPVPAAGDAGPGPGPGTPVAQRVVHRLTTRGQRTSNAAKRNAANLRFVTPEAAAAGRAHTGDRARVVPLDVSPDQWLAWFGDGRTTIDLRDA